MALAADPRVIADFLRRQGIALPPERCDQVAASASRLTAASHALDERLTLEADLYGFQSLLRRWVERR
jgi:hypothetical protein